MPAQRLSNPAPLGSTARSVPLNGYYPKLLQGASGSVWLVTGPSPGKRNRATGVLVGLSRTPQRSNHKVGFQSAILNEAKMTPYTGSITINAA